MSPQNSLQHHYFCIISSFLFFLVYLKGWCLQVRFLCKVVIFIACDILVRIFFYVYIGEES